MKAMMGGNVGNIKKVMGRKFGAITALLNTQG